MSDPEAKKKKTHSFKKIMGRIFIQIKPHKNIFYTGLALGVFEGILQATIPLFIRYVINALEADTAAFFSGELTSVIIIAVIVTIAFFPGAYFFHCLSGVAIARVLRDFRLAFYMHLQRLSADFYHRNQIGEITNRINTDLNQGVHQFMGVAMMIAWHSSVALFSITMMFFINLKLTFLFLIFSASVAIVSKYMLPEIRRKSRSVADADGKVSATITEYMGASELVRAFSMEKLTFGQVSYEVNSSQQKKEKLIWYQHILTDIMQVLSKFLAPLGILLYGGYLVHLNEIKMGDLTAFLLYWGVAGSLIMVFSNMLTTFYAGLASFDRVYDFFDEMPLVKDLANAEPLTDVRGDISFENIRFNYPIESETEILKDLSFEIQAGKKIALVGPSGAGKSTIIQLLLRFYDPLSGCVKVDGKPIQNITQKSLRANIGIVMQDSVFFAGTIAGNMRFVKKDATDDEIRDALEKASALEFVEKFPGGIQAVLGERGAKISGGQKQRLSIARVFLKNPAIVILDEATSSLDSISELHIQEAMEKLLSNRTAIIIAHRIATIRKADEILVIEDGGIVAKGTHEELLKTNALYKELCENQGVS